MDNVQSADVCTSGGWDCYFERISSCDDHDLGGGIFVQLGLPKHEDNRVLYVWALGGPAHLRLIRTAPIASFVRPCTAVRMTSWRCGR